MRAWCFLAVLVLGACRSEQAGRRASSAEPRPIPAPPAGLLAELTVREPAALYASLRALLPGQGAGAPANAALALAAAGNLPLAAANALVLERPCHAAVVSSGGANVASAVACRVRRGPELVQALSAGTGAERRATADAATGLTLLTSPSAPPLGVVDDFLVAAADEATLRAAGPYLARALPGRPLPAESVVVEVPTVALRGTLDRVVRARWQGARDSLAALANQAAAAEGRPPDFGDPDMILAFANERVAVLLELLQSSDRLRLAFTPGNPGLDLRLALTPTPGGAAEQATHALVLGSLKPLLSLPRATVGAGYFHFTAADCHCGEDEPAAAGAATSTSKAAATPVDVAKKALGRAVRAALEESDGTTVVGLGVDRSLVVRRQTRAAAASEGALAALFRAAREPTLARTLEPVFGRVLVREESAPLPGLGCRAHRAKLTVPGLGLNRAEVAWVGRDDAVWVTAGGEAQKLLTVAVAGPESERLAADPSAGALLARHEPAAFALLMNSGALPPGVPEPPSLLSFTRRDGSAVLELDVAEADARRLVKVFLR